MIDRRQMLVAALAAPLLATPLPALAGSRRIIWEPGAFESQHALLVARNLHQLMNDKLIYTTGEMSGMGHKITLSDPRFIVRPSDIMFHPTRGFRYEPSLTVEFFERGFRLGETFMYSMSDYEAYWGKPKPIDYPDFGLRALHTPYERWQESPRRIRDANWEVVEERPSKPYVLVPDIEAALGRDAVGMDDRWIRAWLDQHEREKRA